MRDEIVLIGPVRAGKSTQDQLVAARLGLPHRSIDEASWSHYQAAGYDEDLARRTYQVGGVLALYWYWKPFEFGSLERLVAAYHGCVFDRCLAVARRQQGSGGAWDRPVSPTRRRTRPPLRHDSPLRTGAGRG